MALSDYQFSYNGLTFGDGTPYMVDHHEGLEGYEVRVSDSDQPRGDGGIRGIDYVSTRTVAFTLSLAETTGAAYEADWAAVRAAFTPSRTADRDLVFKRPGTVERLVRCRPVSLTRVEEYLAFDQIGHPPVVLRAVDPRIYSSAPRNGNVPIFAPVTGGMDWPVINWPLDYSGGSQNLLAVSNAGTADAYPLVRFYGPVTGTCTGVTLTNTTTGDVLQINTSVSTGQILTADMTAAVTGANSLVVSLDGSSRYGSWVVPRSALRIAPGSNLLKFQVTGTSTDMVCNITWNDTWID